MKMTFHAIIIFSIMVNFEAYSDEFMAKSSGFYLRLYQNYASPIRANYVQCGFYPSCSNYSKQALLNRGFVRGLIMTGDRLMRCHPNLALSRYWGWSNQRIYDPPQFESAKKPNYTVAPDDMDKILSDVVQLVNIHPWIRKIILDEEYELTIVKLKEIHYFNNVDSLESMINYLLGWLNERINDQDKAISYYKKASFSSNYPEIAQLSFNRMAEIYLNDLNLNHLQVMIDQLNQSQNSYFSDELVRWKYLCYIGSGNFDKVSLKLSNPNPIKYDNEDKINKIVFEFQKGPPGSPLLAGISGAILPGTGYLIGGENKDAFQAFLTNLLLIGGTIQLINNKSYMGATFLGMFTLPFYLGNIYGGINAIKLKQVNWRQQKLIEMKIFLEL